MLPLEKVSSCRAVGRRILTSDAIGEKAIEVDLGFVDLLALEAVLGAILHDLTFLLEHRGSGGVLLGLGLSLRVGNGDDDLVVGGSLDEGRSTTGGWVVAKASLRVIGSAGGSLSSLDAANRKMDETHLRAIGRRGSLLNSWSS
jgi:hypothetical protein